MAIMTEEIGVFSNPIRVTPINLLNQMLNQASKLATSRPGRSVWIWLIDTPSKFFSQILSLRGAIAIVLLLNLHLLCKT
jgi:hypothetical protein